MRSPLTLLLALLLLSAAPAAATTFIDVPLTQGTIAVHLSLGTAVDSTLGATGPDFVIGLASGPIGVTLPGCVALCTPGATFSPGMNVFGAIAGEVTYAGLNQPVNNAPVAGNAFASWVVTADSFVLPAFGDPFTITEPFALSIEVRLADCPTCQSHSTTILAFGAGLATLSFANDGVTWGLTSTSYSLVAEPGAWPWLVAAAACLALVLSRKRRQRPAV